MGRRRPADLRRQRLRLAPATGCSDRPRSLRKPGSAGRNGGTVVHRGAERSTRRVIVKGGDGTADDEARSKTDISMQTSALDRPRAVVEPLLTVVREKEREREREGGGEISLESTDLREPLRGVTVETVQHRWTTRGSPRTDVSARSALLFLPLFFPPHLSFLPVLGFARVATDGVLAIRGAVAGEPLTEPSHLGGGCSGTRMIGNFAESRV